MEKTYLWVGGASADDSGGGDGGAELAVVYRLRAGDRIYTI